MPDTIRDGRGTGTLARVNSDGMLYSRALDISRLSQHSLIEKNAYSVHFHHVQKVAGVEEVAGYLIYTGDKSLCLSDVIFSTKERRNTAAFATTGATMFLLSSNGSGYSGGVIAVPVNMNLSSNNTLDATCYQQNTAATPIIEAVVGKEWLSIYATDSISYAYDLQAAIILGKNNVVAIIAQADTVGTRTDTTLFVFETNE